MASNPPQNLGSVLVIGGCGFVGHHIVNQLLTSTIYTFSALSVLDLRTDRNRSSDSRVKYYNGDITSRSSIEPCFAAAKPSCIIHTASPVLVGKNLVADAKKAHALYQRVNVDGTKLLLEVSREKGVHHFIYTSSASILSDNSGSQSLINASESHPVILPPAQREFYSTTKALAEAAVLSANDPQANFLTCALRPAGIFGDGDIQLIPGMLGAYTRGQTAFQIGQNTNLFDFTYVGNVAWAHLLAASALVSTSALSTRPLDSERVDGEPFLITNGSPVAFWNFARALWSQAHSLLQSPSLNPPGAAHIPLASPPRDPSAVWTITGPAGLALATLMEYAMWALGKKAKLGRTEYRYSCMTRYFDVSKAVRRLGYQPRWSLEEGIDLGVRWWIEEQRQARLVAGKEG